jgi:hypothetical protein
MSIAPKCDKCGEELTEFGGTLLSPPDENGLVRKFHLCKDCYRILVKEMMTEDKTK